MSKGTILLTIRGEITPFRLGRQWRFRESIGVIETAEENTSADSQTDWTIVVRGVPDWCTELAILDAIDRTVND